MKYQYSEGRPTGPPLFSQLLGFCGPGCCGGNYSVDIAVYFTSDEALFGISRVGADMTIPVMSNLTVNSSFAVNTGGDTTLDVGWTFKF